MKDRGRHTLHHHIRANLRYSLRVSVSVALQKTTDKDRQVMMALWPKLTRSPKLATSPPPPPIAVLNVTLNITRVLCSRIHCIILKGSLSMVACHLIKLDAHTQVKWTMAPVPSRVWMRSRHQFTSESMGEIDRSAYKAA